MQWVYDLTQEIDPLLRLGIHGLWRHLTYGSDTPSDTLSWVLTDTTIILNWKTVDDLNRLMARMVGDLPDGFCVPPGYPTDRRDQSIYSTILAHKGITQHFFAKKGSARTRSESKSDKVDPVEAPWSTEEKIKMLELSFTQHRLHDDTPALDVNAKGVLKKAQAVGCVYHPMVSQWNSKTISVDPQTKFVLAFACLAHIFTRGGDKDIIGLGLDAPTFSEADEFHMRWMDSPLLGATDHTVAVWGMATLLDLPPGTYVQTNELGSSYVVLSEDDIKGIYPILREGMGGHDGARMVKMLSHVQIPANRDAYTQILQNVHLKRTWYTGVHPLDSYPRTREAFTNIFYGVSSPMEHQIAASMSKIRSALAAQYGKRYGLDIKRSFDRADNLILNVHLNRARNRPALLKALATITQEAGRGFSSEEMDWILTRSEKHPSELQSLLILACTTFRTNTVSE